MLLQKDLELHKVLAKNSDMEKANLMKQISDIKVQHSNEKDLLQQKLQRRFESELEDEKQGILQQNEDLTARHKKTQ